MRVVASMECPVSCMICDIYGHRAMSVVRVFKKFKIINIMVGGRRKVGGGVLGGVLFYSLLRD